MQTNVQASSLSIGDIQSRRFKCVVAYDGTDFCGWQSQLGGGSIQDYIEQKLYEILKVKVRIQGSGRTDAGVHARGQVFHFDAIWKHSTDSLLKAMRAGGNLTIQFLSLEEVSADFHARFSAVGKRYIYRISMQFAMPEFARYSWSLGGRSLDIDAMKNASKIFIGTHDFKAFSANRGNGIKEDTIKTIYKFDIQDLGDEILITTEGSGYLYKMVRLLVGAIIQCGSGRLSEQKISDVLKAKERTNIFQVAPAKGLFLDCVFYK